MPPRRDNTRRPRQRRPQQQESRALPYTGRNVRFFALGIVAILLGYFCLSRPPVDGFLSLTLAPILLVLGYCILIPVGLLIGDKKSPASTEEAEA